MTRIFTAACFCLLSLLATAQEGSLQCRITGINKQPLPMATVELLTHPGESLVKLQVADSTGLVQFNSLPVGGYTLRISHAGYATLQTGLLKPGANIHEVILQTFATDLAGVKVTAKKPFIELSAGKTIVNLEASTTIIGATAMEALEKMPGITIDKDGNIALKGRPGVLILIDGKQTYLGAGQLSAMLGSMSASELSQVEIMDQPSARYDAAGNAGVINIKTKKSQQAGFNATITSAYTQGVYPKFNNNLLLNYRSGKWNFFGSYSMNINEAFSEIYAFRTYYNPAGSPALLLEQPGVFYHKGKTHNLRTGADYTINARSSAGINLNGMLSERDRSSVNNATWMNAQRQVDSLIITRGQNPSNMEHAGLNMYYRHQFSQDKQFGADVDLIGYSIGGKQFFENQSDGPNSYLEAMRSSLPTDINIISVKADYSQQQENFNWAAGVKSSRINTDNLADYELLVNQTWKPDYGKTNHFLYNENIYALYGTAGMKKNKCELETGLRYEATAYDANQLGNAIQKDSSFSRKYDGLFPNLAVSLHADSIHSFSFSAGRRIDRPAFQKLNPFVQIINKYTYQRGNPYYRPQYTWNMQLSHSFKNKLVTSFGYSITTDYFSQVFPIDSSGLVIYTEGNLDKLQNFTFSIGGNTEIANWWQMNGQVVLIHKQMDGFVSNQLSESINQVNLNISNQFKFNKGWSGELSGTYTSRSQNDIQEILDPAGQVSVGIAKTVLQNKGTVKLAFRDLFYTQWMKGNTYFPGAHEYFKLNWDSRVVAVSFTYRFGKVYKTGKRSEGSAGEEKERVGM